VRLTTIRILLLAGVVILAACARKPPIITDLAVPDRVYPGSSVNLTCSAYDLDDGQVSYQWSCSQGRLSSVTGPSTIWSAPPAPGPATVSVQVRSTRGGQASKTVVIPVIEGTPTISSVDIPDCVNAGDSVALGCVASEHSGDSLTYCWTCSAGNLSSPGRAGTTWIAPESAVSVTISVQVRTDSGDTDDQTRTVEVTPQDVELVRWDGQVRAEKFTEWAVDLPAGSRLTGYFSVTVLDVNFYVLSDADFERWSNHKSFKSLLWHQRTDGEAVSLVIPSTGRYHIVLDNSYSLRMNKLCHVYLRAVLPCGARIAAQDTSRISPDSVSVP
jgi:hypothetical protein